MKPDPDFYRAKHEAEGQHASWAWRNPPNEVEDIAEERKQREKFYSIIPGAQQEAE